MAGPLTGVRVVAPAGMGPSAFTGMLLADMGAHVVRVVRPGGRSRGLPLTDGLAPEQDLVTRGVDSIEVDLRDPAGLAAVRELVAHADVFAEGYRPGVAERLGLGPDVLLARNPRLVYARITGYGQDGPLARRAGHDLNYVARSGALHALGGRAPLNLLGDYAGGGMVAAFGIACALVEARASGRGQVVDAAMVDGVALLTAKIQGLRAAGLVPDEPGTSFLDGAAPFYGTYRCADGRDVAVGALEPDFYAHLVAGLVGELGVDATTWPDHGDQAQWPRLRDLLTEAFARRTRDEWTAVFAETDACVSPVLTFDEAADQHVYTRIDGVLHPAPAPVFGRTPADPPSAPRAAPRDVQELVELWSSSAHPTT